MRGQFSPLASVSALALTDDGLVWAGGEFITEGPNERTGLAAFDAGSGAIASFHRDPNGSGVSALVASGSTVYAAGSFTQVGGLPRRNVAAFRNVPGEDGTVLPFDADVDGPVRALALAGDTLYLGGTFSSVNGSLAALKRDRRNLAAVDSTTGLARDWDPDADNAVRALAVAGDTVFAGGEFGMVNRSTPRQRLAAFDAAKRNGPRLGPERRRAGAVARGPRVHGLRRRRLRERERRRAAGGHRRAGRADRRVGPAERRSEPQRNEAARCRRSRAWTPSSHRRRPGC